MKNLMCIITFITFFYSLPAQTQWVATNSRDTFSNRFLYSKGDTLFAGLASAGIYITTDNGNNWYIKNDGLDNTFVNTFTANQHYIFTGTFLGSNGGIFRSADNGEHWERVVNGLNSVTIYVLKTKGDTIFAGTAASTYYTTNNGNEWLKLPVFFIGDIPTLYIKDSLMICYNQQKLFRSENNGVNWQLTEPYAFNTPVNIVEIRNKLVMATSGGGLFRSDDAGKTWDTIPNINIGNITSMIAYDTLLFAGVSPGGIFKSVDNGQTWTQFGQGLPSAYYRSLAVHKNMLYVGTDGRKIWRLALNETSAVQKVTPLNLQMTLYPNPTNQFATLQYNLKEKSFITIALSDVNGRIIKQLSNGVQSAGKQEFNFSVKELIPGNYFCTLSVNSQITSIPLTILR